MFVPAIVTFFARLSARGFSRRSRRRRNGRHHRASAGHRFRHRLGRNAAAGTLDRDHRESGRFMSGRLAFSNRRTNRRIRPGAVFDRRRLRLRRPCPRDHDGGRDARAPRRAAHGATLEVHPLPGRRRIHQRHRGHHLLRTTKRIPRSRSENAGARAATTSRARYQPSFS